MLHFMCMDTHLLHSLIYIGTFQSLNRTSFDF